MDVFAALADPVRRSLLEQLAMQGEVRVVDLTAGRGISRPAVSRHLRLLGEAGLVRATDSGRERHYALTPGPLEGVTGFVEELRSATGEGAAPAPPVTSTALDALGLEVRRASRDRRAEAAAAGHTAADDQASRGPAGTARARHTAADDRTLRSADTEESA